MSSRLTINNEFDPQTPGIPAGVEAARPPKRGPRFTYPSGSQPLEGFTIKRGIGMGGFGEVYFAVSDAGKEVAIKRIQRNLDIELRGVRQCLNLKHVNLISLWDIRANDLGESWVVMEYVPGFNLRDKLEQHPTGLSEVELKQWFLSIASGVNYLHRNGIVHRDLKPGNIFFDTDQQIVKIGDYGLAKFISASKRSGQTESVGTFHYMAPEIGKGIYGKEIDIYALGVILYEMICGQLPFDGESAHEIIMKHLTADVDLQPIPELYRHCIVGALRKDPAQRFSTIAEMLEKLPWVECQGPLLTQMKALPPVIQPEVVSIGDGHERAHEPNQRKETSTRTCLYIGDDVVEEISVSVPNYEQTTIHGRNLLEQGVVMSGASKPYVRNEPIAKVLQGGWNGAVRWWHRSDISVPFKIGVAIVGSILLIINSGWLIPVALMMGMTYLGYYLVRSWVQPEDQANVIASTSETEYGRKSQEVRQFLLNRSWENRLIDLTGSMLVAVFACLVFSFIGLTIKGTVWGPQYETASVYFWLASTATLGSWTILIAGKTWELQTPDFWMRLVTMMICGFAVGSVSYLIGSAFFISEFVPDKIGDFESRLLVPTQFVSFLLFFTLWFGVCRMAQWVDPARSSRIKLWRIGLALVIGSILARSCGLNPPLFAAVAVITSLASQLAAPVLSIEQSPSATSFSYHRSVRQ